MLLLGCGAKKEKEAPEPQNEAQEKAADEPPTTTPPKAVFEGPGKLLVKQIKAWSLSGAPRYFGPDNLYDLINGGAEVYTEYGLKKMVTADYTSAEQQGITITIEIYDMGSSLGAFGRLSRFLEGKADPKGAGDGLPDTIAQHGLFSGSNASFWKGPYLVNLTLLDESPTATMESIKAAGAKALPVIAGAVFNQIKSDDPPPALLKLFPKASMVERSQVYLPNNLMGIAPLGAGFSARYKNEKAEWTLFVAEPPSVDDVLEKSRASIAEAPGQADIVVVQKAGRRIVGYKTKSKEYQKVAAAHLALLSKSASQ
jgi:hypothetical protein